MTLTILCIWETIQSFRNNKASDEDGITVEHWKNISNEIHSGVTALFHKYGKEKQPL